jgi:hypothetical protein
MGACLTGQVAIVTGGRIEREGLYVARPPVAGRVSSEGIEPMMRADVGEGRGGRVRVLGPSRQFVGAKGWSPSRLCVRPAVRRSREY